MALQHALTPEQRKAKRAKQRAQHAVRFAALTPEQKDSGNARARAKYAALTPEQKNAKNARHYAQLAARTPERKAADNARDAAASAKRRARFAANHPKVQRFCEGDGCDSPLPIDSHHSRLFCDACGTKFACLQRSRNKSGTCLYGTCDRPAGFAGFCCAHYQRVQEKVRTLKAELDTANRNYESRKTQEKIRVRLRKAESALKESLLIKDEERHSYFR